MFLNLRSTQIITLCLTVILGGCAVDISTKSFVYQAKTQDTALALGKISDTLSNISAPTTLHAISLTTDDKVTLNGIKLSHHQATANVVLFGGNGMTIAKSHKILNHFANIPVNIIWFDYRGSGLSQTIDALTIEQMKRDATTIVNFAKNQQQDNLPLLVHGISMGSLMAGSVSQESAIDGLILDGAITNVPDLVDNLMPFWSKPFTRVNLSAELADIDNTKLLADYTKPLLILAGDDDEQTPISFAKSLLNASKSTDKHLVVVKDSGHAQSIKDNDVIKQYQQFIESLKL